MKFSDFAALSKKKKERNEIIQVPLRLTFLEDFEKWIFFEVNFYDLHLKQETQLDWHTPFTLAFTSAPKKIQYFKGKKYNEYLNIEEDLYFCYEGCTLLEFSISAVS